MSALAAGVKKRKKSDAKTNQSNTNKCKNEKRRREQENIYIEQLAELISANFADMSSLSVKPDKCHILQETVNQIRSISQLENSSKSSDPVQQGEVSSSRPTILSNEVYGPLLLEALEGFLFVVNAEGKVEHVTDNVTNYIKFTREDILGKDIYNIIHHGDHNRFISNLLPMSIGWTNEPTNKSRSFNCRFLVKPDDQDESIEEKQQRVSRYELMHISSTQLRDQVSVSSGEDESSDNGPCLLCVASRITSRELPSTFNIEQFTTKLDASGKIIGVDTSGVSGTYSIYLNKDLMGRNIQDLCVQQEVHKLASHLRDTLSAGQSTSIVYRLRFGTGQQEKYVHVQTKSKLFKANPHSAAETDFIMATHSIIGEQDSSDPGGGTNNNNGGVGGPLMTSVVNGTTPRSGPPPTTSTSDPASTSANSAFSTSSSFNTFPLDNDFNFDFPTSTWDLDSTTWGETRPESRQSITSVSTPTPRPPSAPAYSPAATVAQSPLAQFVPQPSPTTVPNPPTPANPYSSTFPFSPIPDPNYPVEEQKDTKANVLEEASHMMAESGRLRNLLTKPPNSNDNNTANNDNDNKNKNTILKELLNKPDEDESKNNRGSPRGMANRTPMSSGSSETPKSSSGGGNNMLLQLLNEKNDDDDLEARAGLKKQSELLSQLLKDDEERKPETQQSHDDSLLRSLGFSPSPSPPNGERSGRKRPSDDRDDNPSKRSSDGVSSSGSTGSKLCERNKMLASLLAKQPNNHIPIPPVPASVISATPQEKLPKIVDLNKNTNIQNRMSNPGVQQLNSRGPQRMPRSHNTTNYLNLQPGDNNNSIQRTQGRQFNQIDSISYSVAASTTNVDHGWDMQSDPDLSAILDAVIDFVPDVSNNAELLNLINSIDAAQNNNNIQRGEPISEKMAINIIQKSLMQCESAVNKSPSSPTISLPGTPPAYSSAALATQSNQAGFPPPPTYPRAAFNVPRGQVRPGASQYSMAGGTVASQQLFTQQQRKQLLQQQQEHKRRLLQQQQQQHLLIPSNAAAAEISGLQNIDTLLNNTVAPNVSLQRSNSVPESQLSPTYSGQLSQTPNQRITNQQPYSPHSQLTSPIGQQNTFTQAPGYPQVTTQNTNWQQTQQPRLSVQQQQNPMLNAQLTGNYVSGPNGRTFPVQRAPQQPQQQQQPRAMGSPGAAPAPTRQSPFPPTDSFAPPASPNSAFNQNQYLRLQRTNSAPTATTQLPGGLGSPRPYGRDHPPHPYPPIPHQHHPMMYQQDSQYCYDQSGLPLAYNGADRGRAPPHLQAGVSGSGTTSEYVRQELRAVVGARTGQTQQQQQQQQQVPNRPPSQIIINQQTVNTADLEALGLSFEMPTSGASESPKLWGAMGSDMGSVSPQPATSRSTMEEVRQGDHGKPQSQSQSSLLQKLLSE
ncbi:nuclear receptor coactivator 1 isoform X3 [Agrilus planipennis]|nr:nuclear receptor coactivator 1 isoform X3 [Agrilus planipennis]